MNKKVIVIVAYAYYSCDARIKSYVKALKLNNIPYEIWMLKESYEEDNLVKFMNKYQGNNALFYLLSYLKFSIYVFFKALFNINKLSLIHYNNLPNFIIFSFLLNRIFGAKIILDFHDDLTITYITKYDIKQDGFIAKFLDMERYISAKMADYIITAVHKSEEEFLSKGCNKNNVTTILNVPHKDLFPAIEGKKDKNYNVSFHGTITERLGLDIMLDALDLLKNRIPNIRLNIIGDGDYLLKLKKKATDRILSKNVWFSDKFVKVEDLPLLLSKMNIGIVPYKKNIYSDKYQLPVKIIENLIMGLPTIAPDFENIRRYFDDKSLIYFKPDDASDLADKIFFAYNNPNIVNSMVSNSKLFFESYSSEKQEKKYINIIKKLINNE